MSSQLPLERRQYYSLVMTQNRQQNVVSRELMESESLFSDWLRSRQLVNGQWAKWSVFKWVTWVMGHCTLTYDIWRYSTYSEVFIRITGRRQQIGQIRLKGLTCVTEWFIFSVVLPQCSQILSASESLHLECGILFDLWRTEDGAFVCYSYRLNFFMGHAWVHQRIMG